MGNKNLDNIRRHGQDVQRHYDNDYVLDEVPFFDRRKEETTLKIERKEKAVNVEVDEGNSVGPFNEKMV